MRKWIFPGNVTFSNFVAFLATKYFVTFFTTGPRPECRMTDRTGRTKKSREEGSTKEDENEEAGGGGLSNIYQTSRHFCFPLYLRLKQWNGYLLRFLISFGNGTLTYRLSTLVMIVSKYPRDTTYHMVILKAQHQHMRHLSFEENFVLSSLIQGHLCWERSPREREIWSRGGRPPRYTIASGGG